MFLISEEDPDPVDKNKRKDRRKVEKNKKKSFYLLLSQKIKNLIRAANIFQIKKQIDYAQIDLYVNDPTDRKGRPVKFNSMFKTLV